MFIVRGNNALSFVQTHWHPTRYLHQKLPPRSLFTFFLNLLLSVCEVGHEGESGKVKVERVEFSGGEEDGIFKFSLLYHSSHKIPFGVAPTQQTLTCKNISFSYAFCIFILSKYRRHMSSLSKLDQTHLLEQLAHIGLHETDAIIYLASLRLGACTISQLTDQTKLNRITIHDSVGRLIEK
jgi:hypothetical protein